MSVLEIAAAVEELERRPAASRRSYRLAIAGLAAKIGATAKT